MATAGSYKFSISALDQASGVIENINKKLAQMQAPVNRFNRSIQTFGDRSGISKTIEEFGNLGKSALKAGSFVAKLMAGVVGLGAIGTAAGIRSLVDHFAAMGAEITKSGLILGMSTEKLAKWITMARLAGASGEDITSTFQNLEQLRRDIFIEHDPNKTALNSGPNGLGIAATDSPEVIYQKIIQKLQSGLTPEAQQKLREATGISPNLIRLEQPGAVEKYGKTAGRFAPSGKDVENGDKLNQALLEVNESMNKLRNDIVSAFGPDIVKVTGSLERFITTLGDTLKPHLTKWADDFSHWLDQIKPEDIDKMVHNVIGMAAKVLSAIGGIPGMVESVKNNLDLMAVYFLAGGGIKGAAAALAYKAGKSAGEYVKEKTGGVNTGAGRLLTGQWGNSVWETLFGTKSWNVITGERADKEKEQTSLQEYFSTALGASINGLKLFQENLDKLNDKAGAVTGTPSSGGSSGGGSSGGSNGSVNADIHKSSYETESPSNGSPATGSVAGYGARADALLKSAGVDTAALEGQYGLPRGILAGIKMHESGLSLDPVKNPNSTARGAFQFVEGTAKRWGVDTSSVSSSAQGAAKYLAYLTKFFHGDQRAALAAYGAGEGTIQNLMKQYGSSWDQHLPSEARDLLAKVGGSMGASSVAATTARPANGSVQIDINHNNAPPGVTMDTKSQGDGIKVSPGRTVQPMPSDASA